MFFDVIVLESSKTFNNVKYFNVLFDQWSQLCKLLQKKNLNKLNILIDQVENYDKIINNLINICDILNIDEVCFYLK